MKVFIVYCHPSEDSFTKNMCDAFIKGITDSGNEYIISDLYEKWIRLDARGNKPGVNAKFSIDSEMLAFPICPEKGEVDVPVIYADPDTEIVKTLQSYGLRSELWDNLPMKLGYEMEG